MTTDKFVPAGLDTADTGLFILRIDTYSGRDMTGTVDHIHLPAPMPFQSSFRLEQLMQQQLQTRNVPRLAGQRRSVASLFHYDYGDLATIAVTVLFTQHHTWQGYLQWLDQPKKIRFRSALELLEIIDCRLG